MDRKPPEERAECLLLGILVSGVNVKSSRIKRLHETPDLNALSGAIIPVKQEIDRDLFLLTFPLQASKSFHLFFQDFFFLLFFIFHRLIPPLYGPIRHS